MFKNLTKDIVDIEKKKKGLIQVYRAETCNVWDWEVHWMRLMANWTLQKMLGLEDLKIATIQNEIQGDKGIFFNGKKASVSCRTISNSLIYV